MVVNCGTASFPASLIESEMFGHAKGAFTGADAKLHVGKFNRSQKTGHCSLTKSTRCRTPLQAKLLRAVEEDVFGTPSGRIRASP